MTAAHCLNSIGLLQVSSCFCSECLRSFVFWDWMKRWSPLANQLNFYIWKGVLKVKFMYLQGLAQCTILYCMYYMYYSYPLLVADNTMVSAYHAFQMQSEESYSAADGFYLWLNHYAIPNSLWMNLHRQVH